MFNVELDNAIQLIKNIKNNVENPQMSDVEFRTLVRKGLETLPTWLLSLDAGIIKKIIGADKQILKY